jgi:hypothetical protein
VQFLHRQADGAAAVIGTFMRRLVAAGAERLAAGAGQYDDADCLAPTGTPEGVEKFVAGFAAKGIVFGRAVEGDGCHPVLFFVKNVFVAGRCTHAGSQSSMRCGIGCA